MGLDLDIDGTVWIASDDGETREMLGAVDDPATSYKVPAELLDQLGVLEREWVELGEFSLDCRATAEHAYRTANGI